MIGRFGRLGVLAAIAACLAAPALSQPDARDLAAKAVRTAQRTPATIVDGARTNLEEQLFAAEDRLPRSVVAWMHVVFPKTLSQVGDAMLRETEQRFVDTFVAKFTTQELQQIADYNAFAGQPHIVAALADARQVKADLSGNLGRVEFIRQRLPPADFEKYVRLSLAHPVSTATRLTAAKIDPIETEYIRRFQETVRQYCNTAPERVGVCE